MKTKQSVALLSVSALAAGASQAAVISSGPLNLLQPNSGAARTAIDLNGDSVKDVTFGYEGAQKPYVDARTYVSADIPVQSGIVGILGQADNGLPVTPAGTSIDSSYAAINPVISGQRGYFYNNDAGTTVVGDWSGTQLTEGFVGITLTLSGETHYGWLHILDNPTGSPESLTLLDWAYESTANTGITTVSVVPEPSAFALAGLGIAACLAFRKRL